MKRLLAIVLLSLATVAVATPVAQDPVPGCQPCPIR